MSMGHKRLNEMVEVQYLFHTDVRYGSVPQPVVRVVKFRPYHVTNILNKKIEIKLNSNFITLDFINKILSTLVFMSILAVSRSAKYISYSREFAGVKRLNNAAINVH